jgi:hypothetical protein
MAQLSKDLQRYFFEDSPGDTLSLADVLELARARMFGFLFSLLALPSVLPIPAAGYSIPFGLVMLLLAVQLMLGFTSPWLPGWIMHRPIALSRMQACVKAGIPWIQRIERLSKPRLTPVCTSHLGRALIGCAIVLMAALMIIPIPGINTLAAMGIFVIGFGLLDDDGAISQAGLLLCLIAAIFALSVLYALFMGGTLLFDASV